jgi:hypothetical protein
MSTLQNIQSTYLYFTARLVTLCWKSISSWRELPSNEFKRREQKWCLSPRISFTSEPNQKRWCHSYFKLPLNAVQIEIISSWFFSRKPCNKTAEYLSCYTVLCVLSHHVDSFETRDDELSLATQVQIVLRIVVGMISIETHPTVECIPLVECEDS